MPKVFYTPRPGTNWYCEWDGTNFDELVSYFPVEWGPNFSVDAETQDLVYNGNHFPLYSNMTISGGITTIPDEFLEANFQVIASTDVKFVLDVTEES